MKKIAFLVLAMSSTIAFAQCDGRYLTEIFPTVTNVEVEYTNVYDWSPLNSGLDMDVYTPDGDSYSERPLIIFAHGGVFITGNKNNTAMVELCEAFAKRGYVTASIQYRLTNFSSLTDSMQMLQTVANGISDFKAAIRYFRKDALQNGNTFGIDVDQIYVGGYSAGAVLATNLAFMNDTTGIPAHFLSIINASGGFEGNSGNPGYSSNIKGVVNIAGAVYKSSYINSNEVPIVSVHALDDTTVPFDCDHALSNSAILKICGSGEIHEKTDLMGIYDSLYVFNTGGHSAPILQLATVSIPVVSDFLYTTLDCYGLSEIEEQDWGIEFYPNPAKDYITIEAKTYINRIQLLDFSLRVVKEQIVNDYSQQLALTTLKDGVYFLMIDARDGSVFRKIMLVR